MKRQSKYIGKVYDGFEVVFVFEKNPYIKRYGKETKPQKHPAYDFLLLNKEVGLSLLLSGNQMRLINNGKRSISEMLATTARGSRNSFINSYIRGKTN